MIGRGRLRSRAEARKREGRPSRPFALPLFSWAFLWATGKEHYKIVIFACHTSPFSLIRRYANRFSSPAFACLGAGLVCLFCSNFCAKRPNCHFREHHDRRRRSPKRLRRAARNFAQPFFANRQCLRPPTLG